MIKGTLEDFTAFIEQKALALAGVNKFLYGSAEKVKAYSRSNPKFGYPLVHLSRPVVVAFDNGFGNHTTVFYSEIAAITKVDKTGLAAEHDAKELHAENDTLNILLELERQLRLAQRNDDIEFESTTEIEPILHGWIEHHTGWKLSCKITLGANSNLCR